MKQKKRNYVGDVNLANSKIITGWAFDKENAHEIVHVKITDADSASWLVEANKTRRDLIDNKIGDGNHAFEFVPPDILLDGKSHNLTVTFEQTGNLLRRGRFIFGPYFAADIAAEDPEVKPLSNKPSLMERNNLIGDVNYADETLVRGWAHDKMNPEVQVKIKISNSEGQSHCFSADKPREDLVAKNIGTGNYGFEFVYPPGFVKKGGDRIEIRFQQSGKLLPRGNIVVEKTIPQNRIGKRVGDDAARRISLGSAFGSVEKHHNHGDKASTTENVNGSIGQDSEQKLIDLLNFADVSQTLDDVAYVGQELSRIKVQNIDSSSNESVRESFKKLAKIAEDIMLNIHFMASRLNNSESTEAKPSIPNSQIEDSLRAILRNFSDNWCKMRSEIQSKDSAIVQLESEITLLKNSAELKVKETANLKQMLQIQSETINAIEKKLIDTNMRLQDIN